MGQHSFFIQLFLVCFASVQLGLNSALNLTVDPAVFTGIKATDVEISCAPDRQGSNNVQLIEMFEPRGKLIASINNNETHISPQFVKSYQVDGRIESDPGKTFLRLVLLSPVASDSGEYTCVLYHRNAGMLQMDRASQNLTVTSVDVVLKSLQTKVTKMQQTLDNKESNIQNRIAEIEEKLSTHDNMISDLLDRGDFISAFSATISKPVKFEKGKPIVFDSLVMELGHDYDNNTGIFTAPRDGLYYFYLTIGTFKGIGNYVNIMVNNQNSVALVGTGSPDWNDENTVSSVVELGTDDSVQVVMSDHGAGQFRNDMITVFGGFCVKTY